MGRLRAVILILATVSAVVLFTAPALSAAGDTVKVYYQDVQGIRVDFPNGKEIEKGGELIIITSSDIYDMERSGIMFFECGPGGTPDRTTSITPNHHSVSEGNTVTHTFSNLNIDIEMDFTELKELATQPSVPNEPAGKSNGIIGGSMLTTAMMLVSLILAAVMLTIMTLVNRMLDSVPMEQEGAS